MNIIKVGAIFGAVATLAACGGSGAPVVADATPTIENLVTATGKVIDVKVLRQSSSDTSDVSAVDGTYNTTTRAAKVAGVSVNRDATSNLTGNLKYVALLGGAGDNKIVMIQSAAAPSGVASYTGTANFAVIVNAGPNAGTYSGDMGATVDVNIGGTANAASVTFGSVASGATFLNGGSSAIYTPTGDELVKFDGLVMSGGQFASAAGSTAVVEGFGSGSANLTTSGATIAVIGGFAGPAAQEVGGIATMTGSGSNSGTVLTTFTGTKRP
jgi:hypothetical protein